MFALLVAVALVANCGPRQDILDTLRDKYGEVVISSAINKNGIVEQLVNEESGTWSTLLTIPLGRTCLVASGGGWRAVVPKEALGEEDA